MMNYHRNNYFMCIPRSLLAGMFWIVLIFNNSVSADVWVADEKSLYKIDLTTNRVASAIPAAKTNQIVIDPVDASVWILSDKAITKRAPSGSIIIEKSLDALSLSGANFLAMDPMGGSIWVGPGKGSQGGEVVKRIDSSGVPTATISTTKKIDGLLVALDRSVWVLSDKRLLRFSPVGVLQASVDLKQRFDGEPKLFSVDSFGAWLWVAANKRMIRVDAANVTTQQLSLSLPDNAQSLSMDDARGNLWILGEKQLLGYDHLGARIADVDLKIAGVKNPSASVFDGYTRSIFVGHQNGVARLSDTGTQIKLIGTPNAVSTIGVRPFVLRSVLSFESPNTGALINQTMPRIVARIATQCAGNPCGFPDSFMGGYRLSATLNGQQLGSSFVIDSAAGLASYVPTIPLQQGVNVLKATATDPYGQVSNEANLSFVIDSLPPFFLSIDPSAPVITNQPSRRISGKLSERGALTIGSTSVPTASDGVFSFDQSLQPGINSIALLATDLAGNQASRIVQITLDNQPPKFGKITPDDGSAVASATISISGSVDETVTITLSHNGVMQTAKGTSFTLPVTLSSGVNILQLSAIDGAGNSAQTSVRVNWIPVELTTNSVADPQPTGTTAIRISGNIIAPPNTRVTINSTNAVVSGNTYSASIPVRPGVNMITIVAITPDGATTSKLVTVNVAVDQVDAPFVAIWGGLQSALHASNKPAALEFIAVSSRERYDRVFSDLSTQTIADVFMSLLRLRRISVDENVAEYFANRIDADTGREHGFFIYFVRDGDGVWRISTM
jgi:Glucodextranase, domain B